MREQTHAIPKALVEIGGKPILWHVIHIYAAQGFRRFVLLTGYLGEMIEDFVTREEWGDADRDHLSRHRPGHPTGGRVARAGRRLR